jgi:predicted DNA-binding WGR domain protein
MLPSATRRWQTATRYYSAWVQCDLLGQWQLVRAWGGRGSRLGNAIVVPANDQAQALQMMADQAKRRMRRHYVEVAGSWLASTPQHPSPDLDPACRPTDMRTGIASDH